MIYHHYGNIDLFFCFVGHCCLSCQKTCLRKVFVFGPNPVNPKPSNEYCSGCQWTGSTIRTLLDGKINPKKGQVAFVPWWYRVSPTFRVVSGDYGKPWWTKQITFVLLENLSQKPTKGWPWDALWWVFAHRKSFGHTSLGEKNMFCAAPNWTPRYTREWSNMAVEIDHIQ